MDKTTVIQEIVGLRQRAGRAAGKYVFKYWQHLDIPIAQLKSLFIILSRGNVNYRILAHDLNVTPGNVTGIVDRMVEQGLIKRKPDSEDRRVIWLEATEKGRELLSNLFETETQCSVRILQRMSLEDLKAFARGLTSFINAVEEFQNESSNILSVKE